MKLAMVIPSLRGGVRYHAPMLQAIAEKGVSVRVFTGMPPPEEPPFPLELVPGGILRDTVDVAGYATRYTYISPRLIASLIRWRPDVIVVVEYGIATLWSLLAGLLRRRPVMIFQEHGSPAEYLRSPTRRLFRLGLARLADGFIANTDEAAQEIAVVLRADPARIFTVKLLLPPPRDYLLTDLFHLPPIDHRPLFLFMGQLIGRKNAHVLLLATQRLVEEGRRFTVWIAGEGPDRESLEHFVELNGLGDAVTFLGPIPYRSTGHVYEASDVFVMPTFADVLSVAVLEAIRFGKPVIGSKLGGFAGHVVFDRENGFLFDPTDATELARYMRAFLEDPTLIQEMGRRSGEIFGDHDHDASADRLVRVLRSQLRR